MKKVLIITYYWPPAGGPGVQRWLNFVKYLGDFEVEPVVYVPENPHYPIIDKSFVEEIPKGVRVIKNKIFEPYSIAGIFSRKDTETISSGIIKDEEEQTALQKAMLYIRGNYFIPDARKFWITPSVKFLKEEIKDGNYDAIITTGPPHSLHLIALNLKKVMGLNWIADFRDPWTQIGYHDKLRLNSTARKKHEDLEKEVLNTADQIITTSFTTREEFVNKTSKPVTVITNGYDEAGGNKDVKNPKFQVAHIGSLLAGRNPENLWKAFQDLLEEDKRFQEYFEFSLAGKVSETVLKSIGSYGLDKFLVNEGYVDHSRALEKQKEASVLLLIEIDSIETRGIIPGKLFEYMASGNPILAVGPEQWDVEKIIQETNSGHCFTYQDISGIKDHLKTLFQKYMNDEQMSASKNIEKYHRKTLTGELAQLIKQF
ncbi:glycosyltransferase family 4 protein [Christiangramia sabulilitoris]|uniref:Glycosyltransferase family 4 protein n=1 Tax=Christiangramia sabulilitoris TaxID=2583991 RepID=A0A550I5U8_9FLAO|nr:glycosyltransferase family 4 protein [Christiangramia sabulilitoris]TRO66349.1 glycosyltransferase family 4 protein [Christiangramia sabulilitoris]